MMKYNFTKIYENIFSKSLDESIYVFLCGGTDKNAIRDQVRLNLIKKGIQVLYPEDLFIDLLNRDKKTNLLQMETILAKNSDVICVICESIGSAIELGAFAQNTETRSKMIAAIIKKHARKKTFAMLGPVRLLKSENKDSVILFKPSEIDKFSDELYRVIIRFKKRAKKNQKMRTLDSLSAFVSFIPVILFFYKSISKSTLNSKTKDLVDHFNFEDKDFYYNFNAAVKYLLKCKSIKAITSDISSSGEEKYELTLKGHLDVETFLYKTQGASDTLLHDKTRLSIMMAQLYD